MTTIHAAPGASADVALAAEMADGLRRLADMIVAHPELAVEMSYTTQHIHVPVGIDSPRTAREAMAMFARAGLAAGAGVEKDANSSLSYVRLRFGDLVRVSTSAPRDEVCERVVIGTREVTETVPDPALLAQVPTVEVTRTVEDVEWVCPPLLAGETAVSA